MKLFLVADGEWSDYHVCGIFSTIEKAEHAKKWFGANNDINEINIDELPEHPDGMFMYRVIMNKNGDTSYVNIISVSYNDEESLPYGEDDSMVFNMWARDEKHAVKIANERRAQLIASNQWITDYSTWYANKK